MAARKKKSASRKPAAKKKRVAKKGPKKAAKKVAKKTAKSAKKRVAPKKAAPPRRTVAPPPPPPMSPALMDIDQRIALVRANLRDLAEQAASFAGAASEELASERIRTQEERLQALMQEREALVRQGR